MLSQQALHYGTEGVCCKIVLNVKTKPLFSSKYQTFSFFLHDTSKSSTLAPGLSHGYNLADTAPADIFHDGVAEGRSRRKANTSV